MSQSRRLAAIMFTDMVGYTAMMQRDESEGLAKVQRFTEEMEKQAKSHNGEVLEFRGDGSLSIFHSAVEALKCAKALQQILQEEPAVPLRIGIHIGDIVIKEGKIYGDGVNLASRVESLGVPGSILVTEQVIPNIQSHPEFQMASLGKFQFKNVSKPMEVFALANEGFSIPQKGDIKGKLAQEEVGPSKRISQIIGWTVVAGLLGFYGWNAIQNASFPGRWYQEDELENPALAVMPFADMSADKSQEYLGDGMAEEVLNLLTQVPELRVISRASSFSFKDQNKTLPEIADKLGVQYILDGSIREAREQVRISAQLIEVGKDQTIWSSSWDRKLDDVFAIQDEIAIEVLDALKGSLLDASSGPRETSPEAYRFYLQARHLIKNPSISSIDEAQKLVFNGLEIDRTYAPLWTLLGETYENQAFYYSQSVETPFDTLATKAYQSLRKALSIDSLYAPAHSLLGEVSATLLYNFEQAKYHYERALELWPNDADILRRAAMQKWLTLEPIDEVMVLFDKASEIDPISVQIPTLKGMAWMYHGDWEQSQKYFQKAVSISISPPPTVMYGYSFALLKQGDIQAADSIAQLESSQGFRLLAQSLIAYDKGNTTQADSLVQNLADKLGLSMGYQVAEAYGYMGKKDSAFQWLDKAYENGDAGLSFLQIDFMLRSLHSDPRWKPFLAKVGFGK